MILEKELAPELQNTISPFREIVAYEALWRNDKASCKTLSTLFKSNPGHLPSDFVNSEDLEEL